MAKEDFGVADEFFGADVERKELTEGFDYEREGLRIDEFGITRTENFRRKTDDNPMSLKFQAVESRRKILGRKRFAGLVFTPNFDALREQMGAMLWSDISLGIMNFQL
jgi:hypothetical protein